MEGNPQTAPIIDLEDSVVSNMKEDVINLNEKLDLPANEIKALSSSKQLRREDWIYYIENVGIQNQSQHKKFLLKNSVTTMGRSPDADVKIISASISRFHAILSKGESSWMIKDTNSTNGVYVNGDKLSTNMDYPLNVGDKFSLGPTNDSEYLYELKVKQRSGLDNRSRPTTSVCMSPPRKVARNDSHPKEGSPTKADDQDAELRKKVFDLEKKLIEEERSRKMLECQLKEKSESEKVLKEKLQEKDQEHEENLNRERDLILKQKIEEERKMKNSIEEARRENEQQLKQLYTMQKQLSMEKAMVEENLRQQLNDKDKDYQEKLRLEQRRLENELMNSETKKAILEAQLSESKHLQDQARSEMIHQFSDIVETEMNCSICSELFVSAITLGCSHTFCQECITTWKRKKKECPICRNKIKSEAKALVIDNFIEKMVQNLPPEMKAHRANLLKERENNARAAAQAALTQENVAANNINHYLGAMWNARANEPTVVINRLGVATGVPIQPNPRQRVLDFAQPILANAEPRTYQNQTIPAARPTYVFSNAANAQTHSIQIDANTIVRVVGNLRMPVNPPETRVHLERLLPATMGRFGTNQPPNPGPVGVIQLPQNHPPRGRTSVLNLAPVGRNMPAPPAIARQNEPIIISDEEDHQTPNRGRAIQIANNRARWGHGQQQRN